MTGAQHLRQPSPPPVPATDAACSGDAVDRREAAVGTVLVYRHRLAPPSEVAFLRRFYVGFERLLPLWLGYHLEAGAAMLADRPLRLGGEGPRGVLERTLFRHCGLLPSRPDLRAMRPLLVHAHFGRGGAFALPIARRLGIPLVVTFHGGDATKERHYRRHLLPPVYQRRLAALQREAALFVCVSEFVRDRLLASGFPPDKLEMIRQGVDRDPAPSGASAEWEEPYVLFVGRFVEKKGVADLIDAMRLLESSGGSPRLVLIGDGPLAGVLRKAAETLPDVVFAGWRSAPEVRLAMRHAAVVCVPSVTAKGGDAEGLPSVVLEAMAEAAPIVATRHAGIAEAVEHGVSGWLVPERDPSALADALRHLLAQPSFRARLGAAAHAVAVARFDAKQQSRLLEAALLRVAEIL